MAAAFRWALDGGALHLYGLDPEVREPEGLVEAAASVARENGAAVCVATLLEPDPWIDALCRCGFERDAAEPTVKAGMVRTEVTLVRIV